MSKVTVKELEKIIREGNPKRYPLGGNLYLTITKSGAASFGVRYQISKKSSYIGLGAYCSKTNPLKLARQKSDELKVIIQKGIDPKQQARDEQTKKIEQEINRQNQIKKANATFKKIAYETIEFKKHEWTNHKTAKQWKSSLETYAFPIIGAMPVNMIERKHVLQILEPIWFDKTETADRVRRRIEIILRRATSDGLREGENPAVWRGNLGERLSSPEKTKNKRKPLEERHHKALDYQQLPEFMVNLRSAEGIGARALELLILTACRTSEILKARWFEFDVNECIWTIPASRMKGRVAHTVPLSAQAMNLLNKLVKVKGCDFLFPSIPSEKHLSEAGMSSVIRRMGLRGRITVHGFRSTFRDYIAEQTELDGTIAEHALAHRLPDRAAAAYQRGTLLEKRRLMMQIYADYAYSENT